MPATTHHPRWPILIGLAGVILAAVVYVLTADVTFAAVRRLLRK